MSTSRLAGWTAWFALWGALGGVLGLLAWRILGNQIPAVLFIAAIIVVERLIRMAMRRWGIGQNRLARAAWFGGVTGLAIGVMHAILPLPDALVVVMASIPAGLHGLAMAAEARYGSRAFARMAVALCGGMFAFPLFSLPVGLALDGALPDFWFIVALLLAGAAGASIGAKLAARISNRLILASLRENLLGHAMNTGSCFMQWNFLVQDEMQVLPVAEEFAKAITAADLNRAYALTTDGLQARMTIEDFAEAFLKEATPKAFNCQTSLMAEESVWATFEYEHRGLPPDIAPESFRQWIIMTFNRDPEGRRSKECWGCWVMVAREAGEDRIGYFETHSADWAVQRQGLIPLLVKKLKRRRAASTEATA